jgi:hypothetical protein
MQAATLAGGTRWREHPIWRGFDVEETRMSQQSDDVQRQVLPPVQLLVYGFGPDAQFEGQLVGALERIESGGALRVLEAAFVKNDPETEELVAFDLQGGTGGMVSALLSFRLDAAERRKASESALGDDSAGIPGEALRELARELAPGAAMAAVLVEHHWARALEDAMNRTGGEALASEFVEHRSLAELSAELTAASQHSRGY